jgi:indole-3-pyruvate monooxygenase
METVHGREIRNHTEEKEAKINTIIIGASAAGLACAATLTKKGIPYLLLEKNNHLAGPWRSHYDRLHLNTEKWSSHLPFIPFPKTAEIYLSRDEVVKYMEDYAAAFRIRPLFNQEVQAVRRFNSVWHVRTQKKEWLADHVIVATGKNRLPVMPTWPGMENFNGQIIHSSAYKNGAAYTGKKVLVVGFGSSACEIAICLHEYGAFPSMSVKGAVNVVPRDAGNPRVSKILHRLAFFSRLFPDLIDRLNAGSLKKRYGFLKEFGLSKLPYGPNVQMIKYKRVPVLDIGTMELIKKGAIKVYPGIKNFTTGGVQFINGDEISFDAVILATGFEPHVKDFLTNADEVMDNSGRPLSSGKETSLPGLFFCGFTVSPYGMLNQIGKEARRIASRIYSKTNK